MHQNCGRANFQSAVLGNFRPALTVVVASAFLINVLGTNPVDWLSQVRMVGSHSERYWRIVTRALGSVAMCWLTGRFQQLLGGFPQSRGSRGRIDPIVGSLVKVNRTASCPQAQISAREISRVYFLILRFGSLLAFRANLGLTCFRRGNDSTPTSRAELSFRLGSFRGNRRSLQRSPSLSLRFSDPPSAGGRHSPLNEL